LIFISGAKWQERRKILTPAFHFTILKNFFDILAEESNRMVTALQNMKDSTVLDLESFISHHTLNIICETSMGISLRNMEVVEQQQYRKALHDLSKILVYRFFRPWYPSDRLFWFSSEYKQQPKCLKVLHGFTEKIIAERKRYHESTDGRYLNFENEVEDDYMMGSRKKRLAMLDLMIAASNNNQMSDSDIREEVDTFMFEGHDTVSMAITFAILLLAEHKDVQDRVRNEVNAVMEENGKVMELLVAQFKKYNPLYKFWVFTMAYISISHPDDLQTLLNSTRNNEKGMMYKCIQPWLRDGLLVSKGAKWQERRKILTPAFHFHILKRFFDILIEESNLMAQSLKDIKGSTVENLVFFVSQHTLNIISGKKRLAMLDLLIAASKDNNLSDLDIREEVDTFMFEGHDTVALPLTFAILLLAEHKDAQVNALMDENGGILTMAALQNMTYLERCLKETIRLYPSVYFIFRKLTEDVMMQSYIVPVGTQVHVDILHRHKNPEFWPNPEVFDPDRFLPELVQDPHPFAYIPFSAGSRNCIGQRFAMMEMKTVISTLVHNYYLEPIDHLKNIRLFIDLIIRPKHPVRIKFVPIKDAQLL
ncbi:Cytochrome P450 4C1, partial [Ooceraea biroi]